MGGLTGSGGGGKGDSSGIGFGGSPGIGLSGLDFALIEQAHGLGTEAIHNRYQQLGLGTSSGDPATAAAGHQSLSYADPSTMETSDIHGLGSMAKAALGQLQNTNQQNPAIPGSVANQAQAINQQTQDIQQQSQQLNQLAQSAGFNQNIGSGVNPKPDVQSA